MTTAGWEDPVSLPRVQNQCDKNCAGTDSHGRVRAQRRFPGISHWCASPRGPRRPRPAEGIARYPPARTKTGEPRGDFPRAPADFRVLGVGRDPRRPGRRLPEALILGMGHGCFPSVFRSYHPSTLLSLFCLSDLIEVQAMSKGASRPREKTLDRECCTHVQGRAASTDCKGFGGPGATGVETAAPGGLRERSPAPSGGRNLSSHRVLQDECSCNRHVVCTLMASCSARQGRRARERSCHARKNTNDNLG